MSHRVIGSLAVAASALALAGCATNMSPPLTGYLCCNLSVSSDVIYASNPLGGTLARAGESVRIEQTKRNAYFWGYIGDNYVGFTDDVTPGSSNATAPLEWMRRIVVQEDPRKQLSAWPVDVRNAVLSGRVFVGMTKPQVLMALGYPSLDLTPAQVSADTWKYNSVRDDQPLELRFGANEQLAAVEGPQALKTQVEFLR